MKTLLITIFLTGISVINCLDTECIGSDPDALREPNGPEIKQVVTQGERGFSVRLIKSLFTDFEGENKKNIFISPSSIYQTLLLSYFGAEGATQSQLESTLGVKNLTRTDIVKHYLFERAFQAIRERSSENLGYELIHANKFYFDRTLPLSPCLVTVLNGELEALDFKQASKARQIINRWVEDKTKNKIRELLPEGSLKGSKATLVNAAYFKGEWSSKFQSNETKLDNFYVKRDTIKMVEFMQQKGKFNYYTSEALRAHVLEMNYIGEHVSMIIILPPFEEDSLNETVNRLTPETLQGVMAEVQSGFYQMDDLNVKIPKFNVEQSFQLSDTLSRLGVENLFDPLKSDLSGFLDKNSSVTTSVTLQSAVHKSYIEVNEEGSEAAAATALFGFRSARPLFHKDFVADHPFLFLIYDKQTDIILFFGVYQSP